MNDGNFTQTIGTQVNNHAGSAGGGIGIAGLLGIVFITLKLCGVISWSWLWVLAPFWIPIALVIGIMLLVLLFCGLIFGVIGLITLAKNSLDRRKANREFTRATR